MQIMQNNYTTTHQNKVWAKMKQIMALSILWKGSNSLYEVCANYIRFNICMIERMKIMQQMVADKQKVSSKITPTSSALANAEIDFISFFQNVTTNLTLTLRMRSIEKINTSRRVKHHQRGLKSSHSTKFEHFLIKWRINNVTSVSDTVFFAWQC